jgi:hypothetical protein
LSPYFYNSWKNPDALLYVWAFTTSENQEDNQTSTTTNRPLNYIMHMDRNRRNYFFLLNL